MARPRTCTVGPSAVIPTYAMIDVWVALGGDVTSFDRMWAEPHRTPADTWGQLLAVIRDDYLGLIEDTNPPMGPEIDALITARTGRPQGGNHE